MFIFIITLCVLSSCNSLNLFNPNLCINCKYFMADNYNSKFSKCALFPIPKKNYNLHLVNGEVPEEDIKYNFCATARNDEEMCGITGKKYIQDDQ